MKRLIGKKIGFGVTGSHCTLKRVFAAAEILVKEEGAELFPVFSPAVAETDTRFGTAVGWMEKMRSLAGREIISSVKEAEPIGPKHLLDAMVIAPASGNTIGKLVNGIVDTPVLMAAKAHLRNGGPVIIAISTNDGLGISGSNIGKIANMKNVFLVPFGQDDPVEKPNSLVARMELIPDSVYFAVNQQQIQPVLIEYSKKV